MILLVHFSVWLVLLFLVNTIDSEVRQIEILAFIFFCKYILKTIYKQLIPVTDSKLTSINI